MGFRIATLLCFLRVGTRRKLRVCTDSPPLALPQLRFYFSDANLRRDKFLKAEIDRDRDRCMSTPLYSFIRYALETGD